MQQLFSKMKEKNTLQYIIINECHCIDMWGLDFRPAYANLGSLSNFKCPIVAMTGTCTARTEEVILTSLSISDATVVRQSCNRENISLFVKAKKKLMARIRLRSLSLPSTVLSVALSTAFNGVTLRTWPTFCKPRVSMLLITMVHLTPTRRKSIFKLGRRVKPPLCEPLLHLVCA